MDEKETKLKKLHEILTPGGPCYNKILIQLQLWKETYESEPIDLGDQSIINFINYFIRKDG